MMTMVAIFVVLFVLLALAIDSIVRRMGPAVVLAVRREIPLPAGLFLDSGHTWSALESSGRVRVGMDDLIRAAIGKADSVELPEPGKEIRRGEPLFSLSRGGRRIVVSAPMDGIVRSVNPDLAESAAALEHDPYRKGWICALSPANLGAALKRFRIAEDASEWLRNERARFDAFVADRAWASAVPGTAMADGGKPADGILEHLHDEAWDSFRRDFLTPAAEVE
jgi:glycine cleavage system H lipoate-binding protein